MNIVINYKNEKLNINDFTLGRVPSNEYYCIRCEKRVYYVKEHIKTITIDKINNITKEIEISPYFRHEKVDGNETECEYYLNKSTEERKNETENRKSEYHNHWQKIFPTEYLEYKIEENNKKHFADIYIYNNDKEIELDLLKNYKPKSLIIEIQHSKISEETLKERTLFYQNEKIKRELIWIFDLHKKCRIYKIITYTGIQYRIKLTEINSHSFPLLYKNNEINNLIILLDNGCKDLYYIKDKINLDNDFIEVEKIDREYFLNQIGEYIEKEIRWNKHMEIDEIEIIDYEEVLINKEIDENKKDKIRHIFYLLENIPYYELKGENLDILYLYLTYYSDNDKEIFELFNKYINSNRIIPKNTFEFGKYIHKSLLYVIQHDYLYIEELQNSKELYQTYKDKKKMIEYKNQLREDIYKIVNEHINHYINLNINLKKEFHEDILDYYIIEYNITKNRRININKDNKWNKEHKEYEEIVIYFNTLNKSLENIEEIDENDEIYKIIDKEYKKLINIQNNHQYKIYKNEFKNIEFIIKKIKNKRNELKRREIEEELKRKKTEDELKRKEIEEELKRKKTEEELKIKEIEEELKRKKTEEELKRKEREEEYQRRERESELKRKEREEELKRIKMEEEIKRKERYDEIVRKGIEELNKKEYIKKMKREEKKHNEEIKIIKENERIIVEEEQKKKLITKLLKINKYKLNENNIKLMENVYNNLNILLDKKKKLIKQRNLEEDKIKKKELEEQKIKKRELKKLKVINKLLNLNSIKSNEKNIKEIEKIYNNLNIISEIKILIIKQNLPTYNIKIQSITHFKNIIKSKNKIY